MKRMTFQPPTEHYDERIEAIDEQICSLIKKRKELSNDNPGFPKKQLIASWAKKYDFYEDFLNSVFADLLIEEIYKPVVEPKGFRKNIPLLKVLEKDDVFYSVTFIRQFENASIVHFSIDRHLEEERMGMYHHQYSEFELSIEGGEADYHCVNQGGGGSGGHMAFNFIVSPVLPDNCSKYTFVFKEYKEPFRKSAGVEFSI